jgi:hypothetical protein
MKINGTPDLRTKEGKRIAAEIANGTYKPSVP